MSATKLMADLARLGIRLEAHGDRLRYHPQSAMTPDLMARLKAHKAELLAILRPRPDAGATLAALALDSDPWEQCIEPTDPCPKCGSLVFWWNLLGDRRCMTCDPPIVAIKAMERAEQIRRQHRIPSPAGTAERLADLRRITENAS